MALEVSSRNDEAIDFVSVETSPRDQQYLDNRLQELVSGGTINKWRSYVPIYGFRILLLVAILGFWQISVNHGWFIKKIFTASPTQIWDYLKSALITRAFWSNAGVTARESVVGWLVGGSLGIIVGLVLGQAKRVNRVLNPFLTFANATPKIGIAPILIVWFGVGELSKEVLAALVVFFIVEVPTHAAASLIDPDLDLVADTLGASRTQRLLKVVLPGVLPAVLGALRLGIVFAFLAAVFGEIIAAQAGLGQLLETSSNEFNMSAALGITIVLAIIVLILAGILGVIERRLLRWTDTSAVTGQVASI